jgi:hypothetical protein
VRAVILNGADRAGDPADVAANGLEARYLAHKATVRHFILRGQAVGHCQGDFDCWVRTPGRCRIKDEGQDVDRDPRDTPNGVTAEALAQGRVPACITRLNGPVRFRRGTG